MNTRITAAAALALVAGSASAQIGLSTAVNYPCPTSPDGIASGDFNNDGTIDLAVAVSGSDKVSVFFNNGAGSFAAPIDIPTGAGTTPNFIRSTDIDGDGDPDLLVVLNGTQQVLMLTNNGTGTFTAAGTLAVGTNPRWMIASRLDAGTTNDIIVANRDAGTVTVLLNNGGLTFSSATYTVGTDPRSIAVVDLNGDQRPEVFVSCRGDRTIALLNNNGSGVFTVGTPITLAADLRPNGIVTTDVDRDSDLDLVVAVTNPLGAGFVQVYLNTAGAFGTPTSYGTGAQNPGQVAASDLDRDGDIDLITINPDNASVSVLNNAGNGTFGLPQQFEVGTGPRTVNVADFDQDFIPDLAVTNLASGTVSILINTLPSPPCYANCDGSSVAPVLNALDFGCFVTAFGFSQSYANCDGSTAPPVLNASDFACFLNKFAAGCS